MQIKKYSLLFIVLCFFVNTIMAQNSWSGNIAEIIYENCTSCHNPAGIGPFSLMDYEDAQTYAYSIQSSVETKSMPPWIADNSYQSYAGIRGLSEEEIKAITDWINGGLERGIVNEDPPKPVYNTKGFLQNTPDLSIQIPTYTSKASEEGDDYVCFTIPSNLANTRKIKAVEVIPGNLKIVHHALVFLDDSHSTLTDTIGGDCASPSAGTLVTGYVPGSTPIIFPENDDFKSGMTMTAGTDVIISMHFPEGSYGEKDNTKVNFYFYNEGEDVREIYAANLLENWTFYLPADQTTPVTAKYPSGNNGIPFDATLMSVFPHMHLLGESIKSYAITPESTEIPLINIPKWDFEWQDFYFFEHLIKLPQGSFIHGEGSYNNTAQNPDNPNKPPKNVYPGLNTTDEMFLFYNHYMAYQEGDEYVNVDSLTKVYLSIINPTPDPISNHILVFPNPVQDHSTISYYLIDAAFVSIYIYDSDGRIVTKLLRKKQFQGNHQVNWDTNNLPKGLYFYSMSVNGVQSSGRIVKI